MVNKPAELLVHPDSTDSPDLISELSQQLKQDEGLAQHCLWDGTTEPSVAHRLDKGVSGIVLVALDTKARSILQKQFQEKTVRKTYHAIVHGHLSPKEGCWRKTMTKKAEGKSNPAGYAKKRVPTETHFKVLTEDQHHSLLELSPKSGRKHQLRRHCALAHCPIVGDLRYGQSHPDLNRILLHAQQLRFSDPWDGHMVEASCPAPFELSGLPQSYTTTP